MSSTVHQLHKGHRVNPIVVVKVRGDLQLKAAMLILCVASIVKASHARQLQQLQQQQQ